MSEYQIVTLDELAGGNVLLGPEVSREALRTNDIMIGFNRNDRPWKSELHYHERSIEIYIILRGGLTFRICGESVHVKSGQMLVVNRGVPHDIETFNLPIEFITIRAPATEDKVVTGR